MKLVPNFKGTLMNALIPTEVKDDCTAFFATVMEPLDDSYISDFIDQDISLWKQIIPPELKQVWIDNVGQYSYLVKLADREMILGWVVTARPDLKQLFETPKGRLWFYKQWTEIMNEIGAG